jgi:hypothetical protein
VKPEEKKPEEKKPEEKKPEEKKPEEKKPEEKKPEEKKPEEKKPEEKKPEEPVKPAFKKLKTPKGYEGMAPEDKREIAEVAASAAASAVATAVAKQQPQRIQVELLPEENEQVELAQVLEITNPRKYPKGTADGVKRVIETIKQKSLDPEGEEASGLWKALGVEFTDEDLEVAKLKRETVPIQRRLDEQIERNLALERRLATMEAAPLAKRDAVQVVEVAADLLGSKDAAAILDSDGELDKKRVEQYLEARPDDGDILVDAVRRVSNFTKSTRMAFSGADMSEEALKEVETFCKSLDQDIASTPELRVDDKGREFVPLPQFNRLSRAEKAKHWTLTPEYVQHAAANIISRDAAKAAEQARKQAERILAKHGITPGKPTAAAPVQAAAPAADSKPSSPSTGAAVMPGSPAPAKEASAMNVFARAFYGDG